MNIKLRNDEKIFVLNEADPYPVIARFSNYNADFTKKEKGLSETIFPQSPSAERGGLSNRSAKLKFDELRCASFQTRFSSNSLKRKMPDLSIEHFAERGGVFSNPNYAELERIHELVLEIERNNSGNENVLIKTGRNEL